MKFQKLLLTAEQDLGQDKVRALVFLCKDLCCCTEVKTAKELFSLLCDQGHLSEQRPYLLTELLSIIQHKRLLRDLGLDCSEPTNLISAYRCGYRAQNESHKVVLKDARRSHMGLEVF